MKYCTKCGQQLPDGAKFCAECGAATAKGNSDEHTERKIVYDGKIHKCPNCGNVLNSFESVCHICGYELRDSSSANAVKEFSNRLNAATTEFQRASIIRSFPIPNTKEDIFEFMILASSNIDEHPNKDVFDAWIAKFEQCYQKANIVLYNDPDFFKIQTFYINAQRKLKKHRKMRCATILSSKSMKNIGSLLKYVFDCAGFLFGIIAYCVSVAYDTNGENGVGWEMLGGLLLIISTSMLGRKNAKKIEFVAATISIVLSFVLASFLNNGVFLQLVAIVLIILIVIFYFRSRYREK